MRGKLVQDIRVWLFDLEYLAGVNLSGFELHHLVDHGEHSLADKALVVIEWLTTIIWNRKGSHVDNIVCCNVI